MYKNEYLTGIDFPVGPIGAGSIRMNGRDGISLITG